MLDLARRGVAFLLILIVGFPGGVMAQQRADSITYPDNHPRKQMATIVISGLGGGILGLSTLSFYGRPQDHLNNIAIGFAMGVLVGTSYVTYRAARDPYERRYQGMLEPTFNSLTRQDWAHLQMASAGLPPISWQWEF